jgi:hypothetical protein
VTPPAPVVRTELARILYGCESETRNVSWLAAKLGVSRQTVGQWVSGNWPVPRKRQAQIRVHVEEPSLPLFDERGTAIGRTR